MRIVITINDPPPEFDRCLLSLELPDSRFAHSATIARLTDGTWSVISHVDTWPRSWSRSKLAPGVIVAVKP